MADYIDRQAAIEALDAVPYDDMLSDEGSVGESFRAKKDKAAIESVPSEDVEPVRRGKWIVSPREEWETFDVCTCSACNTVEYFNVWWTHFSYCPNCGARMDGDGK